MFVIAGNCCQLFSIYAHFHGRGRPVATIADRMSNNEKQIRQLFTAELQFRLASAVRVATSLKEQPLDLPVLWTHGKQSVTHRDIALRQDQADFASFYLHQSSTFLMAVAMKDALKQALPDPKNSSDSRIRAAYQISRLIRNAFAHAPFKPTWSIDPDCRNTIFSIPDIISLDTSGLEEMAFNWRHYGGPLALFQLSRFIRIEILKDAVKPRKEMQTPEHRIYQQGNLILKQIDKLPKGIRKIQVQPLSDGSIPLGHGHFIGSGSATLYSKVKRRTSGSSSKEKKVKK